MAIDGAAGASTPARTLRRRIDAIGGTVTNTDGIVTQLTRRQLLDPLETALRAMSWSMVALAVALIVYRTNHR